MTGTVDQLRADLASLKRVCGSEGYNRNAEADRLSAALDELATLRASNEALVSAIFKQAARLALAGHHECKGTTYINREFCMDVITELRAALTPKATTTNWLSEKCRCGHLGRDHQTPGCECVAIIGADNQGSVYCDCGNFSVSP